MNKKLYLTLKGFTLVELLIVVGVLAIMASVVVIILNPTQILAQARDSRRLSDLATIKSAIQLYQTQASLPGSSTTVYISLPDTSSTCANLTLPALPSGWSYGCVASANLRKSDGTGWIPVDFASLTNKPLSVLPIDPVNNSTKGMFYTFIPTWTTTAVLESTSSQTKYAATDGGQAPTAIESGNNLNSTPGSVALRGESLGVLSTPYVWVTNRNDNTVSKLDYSTGATIGTYSVGTWPSGIAVDASGNVWVTNRNSSNVTKLNGSTGTVIGTYSVGSNPYGVAVDGSGNVWVANEAGGSVTKLNGSTGAVIGTYAVQSGTFGIAVDASGNIWAPSSNNNTVAKLNGSTGAVIGNYSVGTYPYGVAADASGNIWVANLNSRTITKLNGSTGALIGNYAVPGSGQGPDGVAVDASGNVWVSSQGDLQVTKLNGSTGAVIGSYSGISTIGVAVDASGNIWAPTLAFNNITKLNGSTGATIGTYSVGTWPESLGDSTGFAYQYFILGRR